MDFLLKKYGTINPDEIIKIKEENEERLDLFLNITDQTLVQMTVEECKEYCKSLHYVFQEGDEERVIQYTMTDETVDRYGDVVKARGVDLKNFRLNPVVLTFHEYHEYPIGRSLKTWFDSPTKSIKGLVLFFQESIDTSGLSERAFRFAKSRAMTTGSIGFIPKQSHRPENDEALDMGMPLHGIVYDKVELLEFSLTPVPANPSAHQDAIRRGIYTEETQREAKAEEIFGKNKLKKIQEMLSGLKDLKIEEEINIDEFIEKQKKTTVQTLIFEKKEFTKSEAKNWAKNHDFRNDKVDETENSFRLRQRNPGDFVEGSFRTIKITKGVKAVIGKLKNDKKDGSDNELTIQSLIFDSSEFTKEKAKEWEKEHGFESEIGSETDKHLSLEQLDSESFESLKTIKIADNIEAVIGNLKEGKDVSREIIYRDTYWIMKGEILADIVPKDLIVNPPKIENNEENKELIEGLNSLVTTLNCLTVKMDDFLEQAESKELELGNPSIRSEPPKPKESEYAEVLETIHAISEKIKKINEGDKDGP